MAPAGAAIHGGDPEAPVKPGPHVVDMSTQVAQRVVGTGEPAEQRGAEHGAARGGGTQGKRRKHGGRRQAQRAGLTRGERPGFGQSSGRGGRSGLCRSGLVRDPFGAPRGASAHEMRRDNRSRRGADEVLAAAQVKTRGVLVSGQHPHHPRFSEHAAAAEHEDVGQGGRHRGEASEGGGKHLYVITYARMPGVRVPDSISAEQAASLARSRAVSFGGPREITSALGPRIRALREAMNLSLRDLAGRSGVSAPMLSQVERGETSPTLQVAERIAAGLELRLSQLLRLDEDGTVAIVRASERRKGPAGGRGHSYEILTPPLPGQRAELSRHVLVPGAATGGPGDPPMHEPGSRETALVLAGSVELYCDGQRHLLSAGDSVTFDADLPHHFENPGPEAAELLAVVSAGLRRS